MSSLAATQADGYYHDPNWDPRKESRSKFQGSRGASKYERYGTIRFELPLDAWCGGCERAIGKGTRFNAQKTKTGESYLSTSILQFDMKCPSCSTRFVIRTDPKNSTFRYVQGLTKMRKEMQAWEKREVDEASNIHTQEQQKSGRTTTSEKIGPTSSLREQMELLSKSSSNASSVIASKIQEGRSGVGTAGRAGIGYGHEVISNVSQNYTYNNRNNVHDTYGDGDGAGDGDDSESRLVELRDFVKPRRGTSKSHGMDPTEPQGELEHEYEYGLHGNNSRPPLSGKSADEPEEFENNEGVWVVDDVGDVGDTITGRERLEKEESMEENEEVLEIGTREGDQALLKMRHEREQNAMMKLAHQESDKRKAEKSAQLIQDLESRNQQLWKSDYATNRYLRQNNRKRRKIEEKAAADGRNRGLPFSLVPATKHDAEVAKEVMSKAISQRVLSRPASPSSSSSSPASSSFTSRSMARSNGPHERHVQRGSQRAIDNKQSSGPVKNTFHGDLEHPPSSSTSSKKSKRRSSNLPTDSWFPRQQLAPSRLAMDARKKKAEMIRQNILRGGTATVSASSNSSSIFGSSSTAGCGPSRVSATPGARTRTRAHARANSSARANPSANTGISREKS